MQLTRPFVAFMLAALSADPATVGAQSTAELPREVERIQIIAPEGQVFVGTALALDARVWTKGSPTPDTAARVFWESSNLTGAWITEGGTVLLFEPGDLTVVARSGSVVATRRISVKPNPVSAVRIKGGRSRSIAVGDTVTFQATLTGRWGDVVPNAQPNWAVAVGSDATYGTTARISPDGRFTATQPGAFTIVAEMNGAAGIAQVVVREKLATPHVRPVDLDPARRVEIPEPEAAPYAGTTLPLRAVVRSVGERHPVQGARITWTSSDPAVASVADDGALSLHAPGRTVVTADNEGVKSTRTIRVLQNPAGRIVLRTNTRDAEPGSTVLLQTDIWAPGAQLVRDARPNIAVVAHDARPGDFTPGVDREGRFVPPRDGVYTIIAEMNGLASRTTITVRDAALGPR